MAKSMTGYGLAQGKVGSRRFTVEVKSVNHKFCEVNLRVPPRYSVLEGKIVEFSKTFFKRGRVDILVREENQVNHGSPTKIDFHRLKSYHRELMAAAKSLKISPEIKLDTLLALPQVVLVEEEEDLEKFWGGFSKLLKSSFKGLEKMRIKEGKEIIQFLQKQLRFLSKEVKKIEVMVPQNVIHHRKQLEERIGKLSLNVEVEPHRLAQEVAYFVDRTDISEELQRLKAHADHFLETLESQQPVGRKLDFLLQEMNREINTLSAKAQNAIISQRVVECKHSLEKMREQVQNVE